jgi:carbon monoxide dehydrogenase subunit G (CoxG)
MAFEIVKTFVVRSPPDRVWTFLIDPEKVTRCLPGAAITGKLDEKTWQGTMTSRLDRFPRATRERLRSKSWTRLRGPRRSSPTPGRLGRDRALRHCGPKAPRSHECARLERISAGRVDVRAFNVATPLTTAWRTLARVMTERLATSRSCKARGRRGRVTRFFNRTLWAVIGVILAALLTSTAAEARRSPGGIRFRAGGHPSYRARQRLTTPNDRASVKRPPGNLDRQRATPIKRRAHRH